MNTDSSHLTSLLRKSLDANSSKPFLIDHRTFTYKGFSRHVGKARTLFRLNSCSQGHKIAIISHQKYYLSVLYVAALLEGVTTVVLDPEATVAELLILLSRVRPKLVFIDQDKLEEVNVLEQDSTGVTVYPINDKGFVKTNFSLLLRKDKDSAKTFPAVIDKLQETSETLDIASSTNGLILFTSGTTAEPKGVVLTHCNLYAQLQVLIQHFGLGDTSIIVNHLPTHHSDGLNQGSLLTLASHGTWLTGSASSLQDLGELLDKVYKYRATHFITVPPVLTMMNSLPSEFDDTFSSDEFSFIESTAGYLNKELWEKVEQRFNTQIVNCYGLTETVNEALYCGPSPQTRKIGTIGKPIGCDVRIVDVDTGVPITEANTPGELRISGGIVMKEYFEDLDATQLAFDEEWLKTGDLAVIDEEGFYSIVGRKSSLIIRGGVNIQPQEVNLVLGSHPAVSEVATVGMEDPIYGERVVSCVLANSDLVDREKLMAYCAKGLAKEKLPNEIHILDEIPYGASGKVNLPKLKTILLEKEENNLSSSLYGVSLEQKVCRIVSNIFNIPFESVNRDSDRHNTPGWDSLGFLKLLLALEKGFGVQISPKDVLTISKVEDIVRVLEEIRPSQVKEGL